MDILEQIGITKEELIDRIVEKAMIPATIADERSATVTKYFK